MYVSRATWIFSYFVLQKMSYNTSHYKPNQIQYMDPNLLLALVQYLNIPPPHGSHCWHWCSISIYLHLMVPMAGTGAVSQYTCTSWFPSHNIQSSVPQHIMNYHNKLFKTTLDVQILMQHFRLSKMYNTDQMNNKNCGIRIRL